MRRAVRAPRPNFEQDELKNEVKGVAASSIGWLTHKHRLTPHVAYWSVGLFPLPPARKWFHLAIVYGDDAKVYINGKLAMKAERTIFKTPPLGTLGNDFIGAYDDLRVYTGVLTQADIRGVMAGRHPRIVK